MPYRYSNRPARDRIVEREVFKLGRRAVTDQPATPSQRELVVASLLLRPDAERRSTRAA